MVKVLESHEQFLFFLWLICLYIVFNCLVSLVVLEEQTFVSENSFPENLE